MSEPLDGLPDARLARALDMIRRLRRRGGSDVVVGPSSARQTILDLDRAGYVEIRDVKTAAGRRGFHATLKTHDRR